MIVRIPINDLVSLVLTVKKLNAYIVIQVSEKLVKIQNDKGVSSSILKTCIINI